MKGKKIILICCLLIAAITAILLLVFIKQDEKIFKSSYVLFLYFMAVLGFILLCILWIKERISFKNQLQVMEKKHQKEKNKKFLAGRMQGIEYILKKLIDKEDLLSKCLKWIKSYKETKEKTKEHSLIISALLNQEKILKGLLTGTGLEQIGNIDEIVTFDSDEVETFDEVKKGDKVRIIEVGWSFDKGIIKKPLVKKENSNDK